MGAGFDEVEHTLERKRNRRESSRCFVFVAETWLCFRSVSSERVFFDREMRFMLKRKIFWTDPAVTAKYLHCFPALSFLFQYWIQKKAAASESF